MALINCAECGNQVSTQASSCPSCGAPPAGQSGSSNNSSSHTVSTKASSAGIKLLGFVLIVAGMITIGVADEGGALGVGIGLLGLFIFVAGRFMDS